MPATAEDPIRIGSGIFHRNSTTRVTRQIRAVYMSKTERFASTTTAPAIAPVAAAVTPRTKALICGFLAQRLYDGASTTTIKYTGRKIPKAAADAPEIPETR